MNQHKYRERWRVNPEHSSYEDVLAWCDCGEWVFRLERSTDAVRYLAAAAFLEHLETTEESYSELLGRLSVLEHQQHLRDEWELEQRDR